MPFSFVQHQNAEIKNVDETPSEFNPYIHGTTTATLSWMSKTSWSLISPTVMLETYQLAPFSGELSKGGLNHVEDVGKTSFARLAGKPESNEYTLEDVIKTYGKIEGTLSKDLAKYDLDAAIESGPEVLYSNINLILIHASRYKQLGGELHANLLLKNAVNEIKASIGIFYLYLILGDYLMPARKTYDAYQGKIDAPIAYTILAHLNAVSLIQKIDKQKLDIQAIYENPTPENLNLIIHLLQLPKTSTFSQRSKPATEHTLEHTLIAEIPSEPLPKLSRSEDFKIGHRDYIFANKSTWTTDFLLWFYINGMYHPSYFKDAKIGLLPHIELLKKKLELLIQIIDTPLKPTEFNEAEQTFLSKPFPLIFIYTADQHIECFSRHTQEYRATSALTLAKDIHTVATDTKEHQKTLQQYFLDNHLKVEVLLFEQLYQARKQLPSFAIAQSALSQFFQPSTAVNSKNIPPENNKNYAPEIKRMIERIKTHIYHCHGGGSSFEKKTYSRSALTILNLLNHHVNDDIPSDTYNTIIQTVQKELEYKRVATSGFFGLGRRDETTVDLYKELYNQTVPIS